MMMCLLAAGDLHVQLGSFGCLLGQLQKGKRVAAQCCLQSVLYHISKGIQKNFLPNQDTGAALLADPAVCQAVIVIDISGLFTDIALPVQAAAAAGAEYFPLKNIGNILSDFSLLTLLCSLLQNDLYGFKQFMADDGFMGAVDNRPLYFAGFYYSDRFG